MLETKINNSTIRLDKGDLTALDIEAIVFYAQPDLKLGTGFGNAIAVRGGSSIQEELSTFGEISVGEAVITQAGKLKSKFIIHAVGPRFQEANTKEKLQTTMQNILRLAEEKGIRQIAFPPMGTGFYGIPLELSADLMLGAIRNHLSANSSISEVFICVMDNREYSAFEKYWEVKEKIKG